MTNRELTPTEDFPSFAPEDLGEQGSFRDRLTNDPSLRYQIRDSLATFDIRPTEYHDLGYTSRSYINMNAFCRIFDIPIDPESSKSRDLAHAFLEGCAELRDDITKYYDGKTKTAPKLAVFSQLPYAIRILGAYKVIDFKLGGDAFTSPTYRKELKSYFVDRLTVPEPITEDLLQGAAIVYADKVIKSLFYSSGKNVIEASNVDTQTLVGPSNPSIGLHLGFDLETAVCEKLSWDLRNVSPSIMMKKRLPDYIDKDERWAEDYRTFWSGVFKTLDTAIQLSGKPESQAKLWQAYLFARAVFASSFEPPTLEGFDGGLDQLVSWQVPLEDKKYSGRLDSVKPWIELARLKEMDLDGLNLAQHSFAIEIIDQLELEIANNNDSSRSNRIYTVAKALLEIEDSTLVNEALRRSPILRQAIKRAMNPWGFRFDQTW
jgi:hypothetical protein